MNNRLYKILIGLVTAIILATVGLIFFDGKETPVVVDQTSFSLEETGTSLKEKGTAQINVLAINNTKTYKLTYTSNNLNVAIVSTSGLVTAIKTGSTTIVITNDLNKQTLYYNVEVIKEEVAVTKVSLNKTSLTLEKEEVAKLIATITPTNATNKTITWSSNNTKVATVKDGVVTAIGSGTAKITVKSGSKSATCTVTIPEHVTGITLNKTSDSIIVGSSLNLTAAITPTNATNKNITWTSSNANVASVNNGTVKGVSAGTATITAASIDGSFKASATITVSNSIKMHYIKQNSYSADAILLESNGHFAMIDTGMLNSDDNFLVINYLKSLKVNSLDFILITHNHNDHIGGATAIINSGINVQRLYIKTYLCLDAGCGDAARERYNSLMTAVVTKNIPVTYLEALAEGYNFNFNQMNITLYNTVQRMTESAYKDKNENNNSVMQLIKIGNTKTFLGADGYVSDIVTPIIKKIGDVDVVKIPHHAYSSCGVTDSSASLLKAEHLIITNSVSRLGGSYYKCVTHFSKSIPRYFVNDMNSSLIVDYSSGTINIVQN